MKYRAGTLVWVKCEDGGWWPAKVREAGDEVLPFLSEREDSCVEFYHNMGELYPVLSTEERTVQPFHVSPAERTETERKWFENEEALFAVKRALRDWESNSAARMREVTHTVQDQSICEAGSTPYSVEDLRNIRILLQAVQGETAPRMQEALQREGIDLSAAGLRACRAEERRHRKRHRSHRTKPLLSTVTPLDSGVQSPPFHEHSCRFPHFPAPTPSPPLSPVTRSPPPVETAPRSSMSPIPSTNLSFVSPLDEEVLQVLRLDVFDNPQRFVLPPTLTFIELLGAVVVENQGIQTTLPTPHAVRETPLGGFSSSRRVLLLPLTMDYRHDGGWMMPLEMDSQLLAMKLRINDEDVPVPSNWEIPSGKESAAVKTSPLADVTAAVMASTDDLFSLIVDFTCVPADMELWSGIVACIFADEVPISVVARRIVENYRNPTVGQPRTNQSSPHTAADRVDVTEGSVRLHCPITTLPMEVPVRGVFCEHLQCMELNAILIHCHHRHIWNCPLCGSPMRPEDMCVNYRLMDWLHAHTATLDRVDYIMETPPGQPLKPQYKQRRPTATSITVD